MDEFYQVLQKARPKDAISVFFSHSFPVQGRVSEELKNSTIEYLEEIVKQENESIYLIRLDTEEIGLGTDDVKIFTKSNQIDEWFTKNFDVPVIVGLLAFLGR